MAKSGGAPKLQLRHWLSLLLLVLAVYVLVPQLMAFHINWQQLAHASRHDVVLAVACTVMTYLAATLSYLALSPRKLAAKKTFIVQLASMFASRLLPAGSGAIGTNFAYLRKTGLTASQAASTVAVNNGLGFIGNMLLVVVVLVGWHHQLPLWHRPDHQEIIWLWVVVLLACGLALLAGDRWRRRAVVAGRQLAGQILAYRHRPQRLALGLLATLAVTMGNVSALYFSTRALGVHVSLIACLLTLTLGVAVGTATPTPGGLGGVEAGLAAGLVSYGAPGAAALSAVLIFRLISYWLALVAGIGAFLYASRRGYI